MRSTLLWSVLLVATTMLRPGAATAQPAAAGWQGYANAWIAAHAQRVHGKAPKDVRKSCEGDLNADGHADVVVIYTIEGVGGGNDWTQYATVLTSTPQGFGATLPKEVGSKSVRAVDGCAVSGTTIDLDVKTYGPKDASCCPSVPGKTRLSFANGALGDAATPAASGK